MLRRLDEAARPFLGEAADFFRFGLVQVLSASSPGNCSWTAGLRTHKPHADSGNGLRRKTLSSANLLPGFAVGDVVKLAELQTQGYAYLRP